MYLWINSIGYDCHTSWFKMSYINIELLNPLFRDLWCIMNCDYLTTYSVNVSKQWLNLYCVFSFNRANINLKIESYFVFVFNFKGLCLPVIELDFFKIYSVGWWNDIIIHFRWITTNNNLIIRTASDSTNCCCGERNILKSIINKFNCFNLTRLQNSIQR